MTNFCVSLETSCILAAIFISILVLSRSIKDTLAPQCRAFSQNLNMSTYFEQELKIPANRGEVVVLLPKWW